MIVACMCVATLIVCDSQISNNSQSLTVQQLDPPRVSVQVGEQSDGEVDKSINPNSLAIGKPP